MSTSINRRLDDIEDRAALLPRPQTAVQKRLASMSVDELVELRNLRIRFDAIGYLSEAEKARVHDLIKGAGTFIHTQG